MDQIICKPKNELKIAHPKIHQEKNSGRCTVSLLIECGDQFSKEVWFRFPDIALSESCDFIIPVCLVPAMKQKWSLRIPGSVSPRLLHGAAEVQRILTSWYPEFSVVDIETAGVLKDEPGVKRGVACFFSAGVDSFYTLFKNLDEIDTLIFIHGFDIKLNDKKLRMEASNAVKAIAQKLGKKLIEVETNLREFSNLYADWGKEYHGSALASIVLFLSPHFKKIYIPGSYAHIDLFPWGSHPELDPLWSNGVTRIFNDDSEADRSAKVAFISKYDVAMEHLRVCWENNYSAYNCGECAKCLSTMSYLYIFGALNRCRTFNRPLDLSLISRTIIDNEVRRRWLQRNLEAAEKTNIDPALTQAFRDSINETYCKGLFKWRIYAFNIFSHLRFLKDWYLRFEKALFKFIPTLQNRGLLDR